MTEASDPPKKNVLAIECAIASGSIALFRDGSPMEHVCDGNPSRAEDVLRIVDSLLATAGITPRELDLISVSTGPGSYSGIRIALATALGLANAVNVPCVGVQALEAMADSTSNGSIVAAVPVGKNQVAWQMFERTSAGLHLEAPPPELASVEKFVEFMSTAYSSTLFAHSDVCSRIAHHIAATTKIIDAGSDIARYIGRFAMSRPIEGSDSIRPLYLRDSSHLAHPIPKL